MGMCLSCFIWTGMSKVPVGDVQEFRAADLCCPGPEWKGVFARSDSPEKNVTIASIRNIGATAQFIFIQNHPQSGKRSMTRRMVP